MIPLNDFTRQWQETRDEALAVFEEVGRSGWYILGRQVTAFESALASHWGFREAVGVGSGLDALEIALRAVGCRAGDKVLTTPLSAFPSTLAILKLRAVPVFVDTDEFGLIDLEACRQALAADPAIRFALPVHLYGHALDRNGLLSLRSHSECRIVEDCAQSIGATHTGVPTGRVGDMAATSFYPTKNLGALGDGGAILSDHAELVRSARTLRDYGQSAKYRHVEVGYNSRLDELQAALLGRAFLPRLTDWIGKRRRTARRYIEAIHHSALRVMGAPHGSDSCWHLFPVLVEGDRRADFRSWLQSRGIASAEHYPIAIPDQPAMQGVPHEVLGPLVNARRICRSEVSLPIFPQIADSEIDQVIDACNSWPG